MPETPNAERFSAFGHLRPIRSPMRSLILHRLVPGNKKYRWRVLQWIMDEWEDYADPKMARMDLHDEKWMRESGISPEGDWQRQILQYWGRANYYGLDTLQGRQAFMKSITTLIDCAASMISVYGDPPRPGYPSGVVMTAEGR